jgi:hypothetical protein
MMHRFGAVFGIAVASSVFAAYGGPGSPALVAAGLRPAVAAAAGFALLALGAALLVDSPLKHAAAEPLTAAA